MSEQVALPAKPAEFVESGGARTILNAFRDSVESQMGCELTESGHKIGDWAVWIFAQELAERLIQLDARNRVVAQGRN